MEISPATKAWIGLAAGIATYEVLCPQGETLSEGVDRAIERNKFTKIATLGAIGITAAHLANLLPKKLDPYHQALKWREHGV